MRFFAAVEQFEKDRSFRMLLSNYRLRQSRILCRKLLIAPESPPCKPVVRT